MRIALDVQSTRGQPTGIGQYTHSLLAALRAVAPQNEYVAVDWEHDPVMRIDRRLRWQQVELPRRARRAGVDLLHVPGFDAPLWRPLPVVLTVHDLIGMLFPRNLPPVARFYWARWLPTTLHFADAIIAVSEATRRDVTRLLGVPAGRIHVVPSGVDEAFRPQPAAQVEVVRAKHKIPADYILFVGTLEPRKGIDTLIGAFAQVCAHYPHDLVLVGKRGWYWQPFLEQISRENLQERVHVLDYVPAADLPALYTGATVLALPSRYEGFGFPVLEAMACGTPVVCSDVSSLPEVAGDAAFLVPPDAADRLADALARLLRDQAFARQLAERGLARAQQFTWERTARQTLAVYAQVTAGKG